MAEQNNTNKKCHRCHGIGTIKENNMIMDIAIFGAPMGIWKKTVICPDCNGTGHKKASATQ